MARLALGTAQFGLNYGINNSTGQISKQAINKILDVAWSHDINLLDTASAYGNSERILGENTKTKQFKLVSKLPTFATERVEEYFNLSLKRLKSKSLYGYLVHDFNTLEQNLKIWHDMVELKRRGKVEKIGVSVYYPSQLEKIFSWGIKIDLLQLPYSIFDRRFENYLQILFNNEIEIQTRSVFLQGLFFKNPDRLPVFFKSIYPQLKILKEISIIHEASVAQLCLKFVLSNKYVSRVIMGIDNLDQLEENINYSKIAINPTVLDKISQFGLLDEQILVPSNWK